MDRKNLARSFLVATVVSAFSLDGTWIVVTEDLAGSVRSTSRNGTVTMPILEAMIALNLVTTLALFLLPRLAQRMTLLLTGAVAATTLWMSTGWSLNHDLRLAPILAIVAAALSCLLAFLGAFSPLEPTRGPKRATERDPWRSLDEGIDPTVDE